MKADLAFSVAQLGARMHYAVPRILERAGMLHAFFTDICADKDWIPALQLVPPFLRPAPLKRLLARKTGVSRRKTVAFTSLGLEYHRALRNASTKVEYYSACLRAGKRFCELIIAHGVGGNAVYTFNAAGLELLEHARERDMFAVMEQTIAPKALEFRLLKREAELHPQWRAKGEVEESRELDELIERERREWETADLILCASRFVADGIAECGGPAEKCAVVPYGVEIPPVRPPRQRRGGGPLRVFTAGAAGLRKGTPYLLEAAKRMRGEAVFRLAGPVSSLSGSVRNELAGHVEALGVVPRDEMRFHYEWADVFFLPSVCEGSATVTYEALAHGLPVLCTPNTGSIVRDGEEGFVVPAGDVDAMVEKLEALAADADLLERMSLTALERSREGSVEAYGRRLISVVSKGIGK